MNDFDYSGFGLFESLASDQQEERRAQRKALVTASARVDNTLGRWLKAAKSGPEFDERYALVQQEFISTIREASEEFGVAHAPVANTIFSHYRTAAYTAGKDEDEEDEKSMKEAPEPVESEKDAEDDDDMSNWHSESSIHTACGGSCAACKDGKCCTGDDCASCSKKEGSAKCEKCSGDCDCGPGCDCSDCACCGGKKSSFLAEADTRTADGGEKGQCSECDQEGFLKGGVCGPCRGKRLESEEAERSPAAKEYDKNARTAEKWIQKATEDPDFEEGGLHRATGTPEDEKIPESKIEKLEEHGTPDEKKKAQFAENVKKGHIRWAAAEGADPDDSYEKKDEELGEGAEAKGNSGLSDKASPVIDKGEARKDGDTGWSLESVDPPSKKHPTERIDPTVVMPRENIKTTVKDQVHGIGESVTESQTLPTSTDFDGAGFAGPNQEQAPHTDQWGNDGQTTPVTNQSLEAVSSKVRWAAAFPIDPNAPQPGGGAFPAGQSATPSAGGVPGPETCPNCAGGGCPWCHHTGLATQEQHMPQGLRAQDATPGGVTFPAEWAQ